MRTEKTRLVDIACKEDMHCYLNPLLPLPKDTSGKKYYSDIENNNNTLSFVFTFLCLRLHGDDSCLFKSLHNYRQNSKTLEVCKTSELLRFTKILKDVFACVPPNFASSSIASGGKGYKR